MPPPATHAEPQPRIGIIAGSGDLPRRLVEGCRASQREVFVLAFRGETDAASTAGAAHEWVDVTDIARGLEVLHAAQVEEVVLAGKISRPSLSSLRPTLGTARLVAQLGSSLFAGDDALFTAIVAYLEEAGFTVIGADDILTDMLTPPGLLSKALPGKVAQQDIAIGVRVAHTLGALDVGQAVVVKGGQVLGVEAMEGTDALLARCTGMGAAEAGGGVLVKAKKPEQERRVDLPTIGVTTVENAHAAGLEGIALEAGGSLVIDRRAVAAQANALGLFVLGFTNDATATEG